jgi:hypothetical protein
MEGSGRSRYINVRLDWQVPHWYVAMALGACGCGGCGGCGCGEAVLSNSATLNGRCQSPFSSKEFVSLLLHLHLVQRVGWWESGTDEMWLADLEGV